MLFLQALMFYLPHIIYEMAEGKKVNIISKNIQIGQMSRGMWTFVLKISQSYTLQQSKHLNHQN